ncbi:hypothetical protein BJV74DRAFT_797819 [Russula compacta]|nr:hypothetical protein BJV74DRAFT_797819 [Russula compacta]
MPMLCVLLQWLPAAGLTATISSTSRCRAAACARHHGDPGRRLQGVQRWRFIGRVARRPDSRLDSNFSPVLTQPRGQEYIDHVVQVGKFPLREWYSIYVHLGVQNCSIDGSCMVKRVSSSYGRDNKGKIVSKSVKKGAKHCITRPYWRHVTMEKGSKRKGKNGYRGYSMGAGDDAISSQVSCAGGQLSRLERRPPELEGEGSFLGRQIL